MTGLAERVEQSDLAAKLLACLSDRQREVLNALYGLNGDAPLNQTELAEEWGVSQSRIWQLYQKAITNMRREKIASVEIKRIREERQARFERYRKRF